MQGIDAVQSLSFLFSFEMKFIPQQRQHPRNARSRRSFRSIFPIVILGAVVLSIVRILTNTRNEDQAFMLQPKNTGRYERTSIDGVDVIWQRPATDTVRGLLFVAHGCSHSHTDFWLSSPSVCPECLGLPEELAIVDMALLHGLVVVAVSSHDRKSKCWSFQDGSIVAKVVLELGQRLKLGDKPIFAFGASSGGSFVGSSLVKALGDRLNGFIAQIAAPQPDLKTARPGVYITMNRDVRSDHSAEAAVQKMKEGGVQAKHIRLGPVALNDRFFSDRIHVYNQVQSEKMVQALRDAKMLDTSGMLKDSPRVSSWRSIVRPLVDKSDTLRADASPVSEVMNVAYGQHEMSRDGVEEALRFLLDSR